jgi:hypothetical protein
VRLGAGHQMKVVRYAAARRSNSLRPLRPPPNRNGARHCCQAPLRRAKDLPVFATWSLIRRSADPFSILAHQLRRRFTSQRLVRASLCQLSHPEGRSVWVPLMLRPKTMQLRCSAALLGATALVSRLLSAPKCLKPRRTRGDHLFRRLFPAGPGSSPKGLSIACRRRSVLWPPAAPSCRCRPSGEAGTAVPIT